MLSHHPLSDVLHRWSSCGTSCTTSSPRRPHDSLGLVLRLSWRRGPSAPLDILAFPQNSATVMAHGVHKHPWITLFSLGPQGCIEPAYGNWANYLGFSTHGVWHLAVVTHTVEPSATWTNSQHTTPVAKLLFHVFAAVTYTPTFTKASTLYIP